MSASWWKVKGEITAFNEEVEAIVAIVAGEGGVSVEENMLMAKRMEFLFQLTML